MRRYDLNINGRDYRVHVEKFNSQEATLRIKSKTYTVNVKDIAETNVTVANKIKSKTSNLIGMLTPSKSVGPAGLDGAKTVIAPLPGSIIEIFVKEGDKIEVGKVVLKMEAMKMENAIKSTFEGTVTQILVSVGDSVGDGQDLVVIE